MLIKVDHQWQMNTARWRWQVDHDYCWWEHTSVPDDTSSLMRFLNQWLRTGTSPFINFNDRTTP